MTSKEYLNKHPEASLKEYLDYVAAEDKAKNDAITEREKKYKEWFESKIGSYFLVDFNGNSKMVFELAYRPNFGRSTKDLVAKTAYEWFKDSVTVKLSTEKNRPVNELWLPNPHRNSPSWTLGGNKEVYELTKEEFDEYVSIFNEMKALQDKCNELQNNFRK